MERKYEKQCPECMSEDIFVSKITFGGGSSGYIDYLCLDCDTEWTDIDNEEGIETIIWRKQGTLLDTPRKQGLIVNIKEPEDK